MTNASKAKKSYLLIPGLCILMLNYIYAQPSYENYKLVWSDEFDGSGLPDPKNWSYEQGYVRNNELQYYTRERSENARMEEGNLIIEARRDNWNGHEYTAASLHTRGKREFQYGIFEIRAKIDVRKGSWPAFWTLGVSEEWPSNGEVDIMEYYNGALHANVAWGSNERWKAKWDSQTKAVGSEFAEDFHIWRMLWTEDRIELYVDDFHQNTTDLNQTINGNLATLSNPFHQKAYIMVNQAIGSNGGDPSGTTFPIKYIIDYVRVYQEAPDTIAPSVVDAVASIDGTISIKFSEGLDKQSAETVSNYQLISDNATIQSASLQSDGKTVNLTFAASGINKTINLVIQGIKDDAEPSNTMVKSEYAISVGPISSKLTGKIIGNGNPYNGNISVRYEAAVDGNTATFSDCMGDNLWVGYDFGADKKMVITGIRYYPRNGYADRVNGRSIEVSNDSVIWENAGVISQTPDEGKFTSLTIVHSEPVRYVRFNGTGGYLNIGEIEFLGYPVQSSSICYVNCSKILKQWNGGPLRYTIYTLSGRVLQSKFVSGNVEVKRLLATLGNRKGVDKSNGVHVVKIESVDGKSSIQITRMLF